MDFDTCLALLLTQALGELLQAGSIIRYTEVGYKYIRKVFNIPEFRIKKYLPYMWVVPGAVDRGFRRVYNFLIFFNGTCSNQVCEVY